MRADPNMGDLVQREHPQNWGGIGVGSLGSAKKPAISPKRCKIGPRLLLQTNIKSYTRFPLVPKSRPWMTLNGVSRNCPKFFFQIATIISGTGKATAFNFGRHIHKVHPNKRPLKNWRKSSVGVTRGCPKFLSTPYELRNG